MTTVSVGAATPRSMGLRLLTTCRPKQWVKNLLVFAAPTAAGVMLRPHVALRCLITVLAMTLTASALYLVNDIADRALDRAHPLKSLRPIAAGHLPVRTASVSAAVLGVLGLSLGAVAGRTVLVVVAVYAASSYAYSVRLKHIPWLEMAIVASGFVLRTLAGAAAARVDASEWFLLVVTAAACFVVAAKRGSEITNAQTKGRPVLATYTQDRLGRLRLGAATTLVTGYTGWALLRPDGASSVLALISAFPIAVVTVRWERLTRVGRTGAPEDVLLSDAWVATGALAWVLTFTATVIETAMR
jgi:decaprenyl-phosphate phosphoribosyltransferase